MYSTESTDENASWVIATLGNSLQRSTVGIDLNHEREIKEKGRKYASLETHNTKQFNRKTN